MSGSKDHRPSSSGGKSSSTSNVDGQLLDALKHYDSFYEKPPPGLIKTGEDEERPEDVIPDTPANSAAREFLAKAPTKGLWMPLGKEVKVMKCWRCKNYGHRTGDKECPLFLSGNKEAEEFRHLHEDPMYNYVKESEIRAKMEKVEMLKQMLSGSKDKKKKKKWKKKMKKKHQNKKAKKRLQKRTRKEGHRDSSSSSSSTSDSDSDSSTSSSSSSFSSGSSSSSSSSSGDDHRHKKRKRETKSKHKHRRDDYHHHHQKQKRDHKRLRSR